MGFDVKAAADQLFAAVDGAPSAAVTQAAAQAQTAAQTVGNAISQNPGSFISYTIAAIILMSLFGLIWRVRTRMMRALEETMFSNWRLGLLGATGIILSLASGYTTWDGMRSFTGEALLSGMVTFGIQGVMLIAAWLIGESFAIGMNQQPIKRTGAGPMGLSPMAANLIGAAIGLSLFVAVAVQLWPVGPAGLKVGADGGWTKFSDQLLLLVTAMLAIALVVLYAASDLVKPYIQSTRIIIRNMVLWVMFLACMATSVFFSFDSLFAAIFPQSERVRAAELRAQNQVAGILADIEGRIVATRLNEAQNLFQAPGFIAYDGQLTKLADASRAAASEIEKYFNDQIEERNRAIKQQQERMATAQAGQAGLALKKQSLADELLRLKSERPGLAAEFGQRKSDAEQKSKDIDAKRVEAMAEAGGVEGSGKEGKGPMYRQRMEELGKLQAALKIAEERLSDARKRLTSVESRITQIEREQSALDGDLAKLKGEQETADQRIKLQQEQLPSDAGARVDPSRITPAFENARAEFRQDPTQDKLLKVQQLCTQIHTAMWTASPGTKKAVAGIDCDPKQAAEAASLLFALNAGSDVFGRSCKGGDKLAQYTSTDALFGFARKCLVDSGLTSKETDQLRGRINFIELNRDDKAHRFVVTWNAFQDGNRLAYLALAIAIAIDSLVFMSGLFGANAVRSPLSDVPTSKARSAKQLEATINAALGKQPYDSAHLLLSELRPITNDRGFSGIVALEGLDRVTADRIRVVLTAGADIHAVETVSGPGERYLVRSELREYLSSVVDKHLRTDKSLAQRARLEQVVAAALRPHVLEHADIVIGLLHPMKPIDGYTTTVSVAALSASMDPRDAYEARIIRRVMNAGATIEMVAPDKTEDGRFYVRPDLYETLLMLSARSPRSPGFEADRQKFFDEFMARQRPIEMGAIDAGSLDRNVPRVEGRKQAQLGAPQGLKPTAEKPQPPQRAAFLEPPTPMNVSGTDSENRQQEFIASLVAALGVDPRLFFAMSGAAYGAAAAASDEFARARRQSQLLDRELTERDEEARMRVDNAFYALESSLAPTDSWNRQALKNAFQDIDQNWSVLMLMPSGPYERLLAELIEALEPEAAAGSLSQRDDALLIAAKQLRQALAANPRNSEAAWQQLSRVLAYAPQPRTPSNGGNQLT